MRFRVLLPLLLFPFLAACSGASLLNAISDSSGVAQRLDVSYGGDPRQTLDVYAPRDGAQTAPVIVFVYGGSWENGSKGMYRFVGNALANAGFVAVIPDYRLFPQVRFPAFVEDVATAFTQTKKTIAGDRPVFIMGHSAGAEIAALVALDKRYLRQAGSDACRDVAGLIGLSGPYDFLPLTSDRLKQVFPEDTRRESQPINYANGKHPPSFVGHGTADTTVDPANSRKLAAALERGGNMAELHLYDGVGHAALIGALTAPLKGRASVLADLSAFVRDQEAKGYPRCR